MTVCATWALFCTYGTPVRKDLVIWPAFPIVMDYHHRFGITLNDEENVIATLKHLDHVSDIRLVVRGQHLREMVAVMQEQFPVLTCLWICSALKDEDAPMLPAEYLGASAPH